MEIQLLLNKKKEITHSYNKSLEQQIKNFYNEYLNLQQDLDRYLYLRKLQDNNETLFYVLVARHLKEMLPIIYTPTVGVACQHFSHICSKSRGLFISYLDKDNLDKIIGKISSNPEIVIVTDGERVLGLGDLGIGGMGILIGKLSLYTLCGGINPSTTLPIVLDLGTNNKTLLNDPSYVGWRHERISETDYDDFIERFILALLKKYPNVSLQWEDIAQRNANKLLNKYQDKICSFNDDIQGTAAVTLAALYAASKRLGKQLRQQNIVIFGAGSAGCGIAEFIIDAMIYEGISEKEARSNLWLIDKRGLILKGQENVFDFQRRFAKSAKDILGWQVASLENITLLDVVKNVKPAILIGVSGQPKTFTKEIIQEMLKHEKKPIIFPLSNPTSKAEAVPEDLLTWTNGSAVIATGSPFPPVKLNGKTYKIIQCNNLYVFPGVGLGIIASGSHKVTNGMFLAAAKVLANFCDNRNEQLFPDIGKILQVSRKIAIVVFEQAQKENIVPRCSTEEMIKKINQKIWLPKI